MIPFPVFYSLALISFKLKFTVITVTDYFPQHAINTQSLNTWFSVQLSETIF